MLEGRCLKCGIYYVGWALLNLRYQTCPKCGVGLEITQDGSLVCTEYTPFAAKEDIIKPLSKIPTYQDKEKDSPAQKE